MGKLAAKHPTSLRHSRNDADKRRRDEDAPAERTPLSAGKYTLRLTIDRDRWPISSGSDPDQHYHEDRTVPLEW